MSFAPSRFLFVIPFLLAVFSTRDVFAMGANRNNCFSAKSFVDQKINLYVAACVPRCQALLKTKETTYFQKNCQSAGENREHPTVTGLAQDVFHTLKLAWWNCLPLAGYKSAKGLYDSAAAVPQLLSYLLTAPDSSETRQALQQCSVDSQCKRKAARDTYSFEKLSDAEIDKLPFSQIIQQAQREQPLKRDECERFLGEKRNSLARQLQTSGEDWTDEKNQQIFNELLTQHPTCPGVLNLTPPKLAQKTAPPPSLPGYTDQNDCLQHNVNPLSCLSLNEQIDTMNSCLDPAAAAEYNTGVDAARVEYCAEAMGLLIPIPYVGKAVVALKSARAAARGEKLASEMSPVATQIAADTTETAAKAENILTTEKTVARRSFVDKYDNAIYVNEKQNLKYIDLAESTVAATAANDTRFFDVENSVMKKLNDRTNDKALVTSLTNFQKESFLNNLEALKAKYPDLQFEVYSDFKSVKIGIKGQGDLSPAENAQLLKDLDTVYQKSNTEFAGEMKRLGVSVPEAGDPKDWFKAGYGRSVDQAAMAARRARSVKGQQVLDYSSHQVSGEMTQQLAVVEKERVALATSPRMSKLMDTKDGMALPHQDVFDMVRKNSSPDDLAKAISSRYGLKDFTATDARQLQNYVGGVDNFSPTLLIGKRENVSFDGAVKGGASADFLGMGSANLRATAKGIASKNSLDQALVGARNGEKEVTTSFRAKMDQFKKVVGGDVTCSGDDCVRLSNKALSTNDKTKMLADLAKNPETRNVRMAFIGPDVPAEYRLQLSSHGESIEKSFRKELEGHVPADKLRNMTFGFNMQTTQLNKGAVDLIVGKTAGTHLNTQDQQEMLDAFARALKKYNADTKTYTQGSASTTVQTLQLVPGPAVLGITDGDSGN